jgi:phosphopantetheine adenylyltransferase
MLESKNHRERLYEYADRERTVLQFMEAFSKGTGLKIDIVRLNDQFGPTITTPDIDLLVVSAETLPGAKESTSGYINV